MRARRLRRLPCLFRRAERRSGLIGGGGCRRRQGRRQEAAAGNGRRLSRSRPPAAPLRSQDADSLGWTAARAKRERTRHAANGAEDGHLRAAAAGAEPREPASQLEAAAAGHHSVQDGVRGGDGSAAGCRLAACCRPLL
jgi:hypothetical protein